jgi:hypothetical protein
VAFAGVQGGEFRSNALLFNGGGTDTELRLELVSGDGTVAATASTSLRVGEIDQINDLIDFFGIEGLDAPTNTGPMTLTVTPTIGGPVAAGVSVIDDRSDDPSYEGSAGLHIIRTAGPCVDIPFPQPGLETTYAWEGYWDGHIVQGRLVTTHISAGTGPIGSDIEVVYSSELILTNLLFVKTTNSTDWYRPMDRPVGHAFALGSNVEVEQSVGGNSLPSETFESTYSPPLYIGPFRRFCEGVIWVSDSVTETIEHSGGPPTSELTAHVVGEVLEIGEITIAAGTFPVVHVRMRQLDESGRDAHTLDQWVSIEHGVFVAHEEIVYAPEHYVVAVIEMTSMTP